MYRGGMTGLGLLQVTPTGVQSVATPTCITQAEKDEANAKCPPAPRLRGIGAGPRSIAPMSGRLAAIPACSLADLPVCPTPTCIDEYTAGLVAQCIAGVQANPDFDCFYTAAFAQLPYCGGSNKGLPPIPACLNADQQSARDYCGTYPNFDGPNAIMNGLCWAAKHDTAYWSRMMSTPACLVVHEPPHRTPRPAPPVATPTPVPQDLPPPAPPHQDEASMMGTWGILALIAAAGGGYYLYRKYKR
jgi:hypothetical protein